MDLPKGSKERKRQLALLQNDGNHLHNCEVCYFNHHGLEIIDPKVMFKFLVTFYIRQIDIFNSVHYCVLLLFADRNPLNSVVSVLKALCTILLKYLCY